MEPVRSIRNQYHGINAHLHSFWQAQNEWSNFHNPHIAELAKALALPLLNMGYRVKTETSLQIRRFEPVDYRPDLIVYENDSPRPGFSGGERMLSGVVVPLPDMLAEAKIDTDKPYRSAVVYRRDDPVQPVAWFEVLSPSNKRPGSDADDYRRKRQDVIDAGVVFVELDYLHISPPTSSRLPDYSAHQPSAHPYHILVFDPFPDSRAGHASINGFDIDTPIPKVNIPLIRDDVFQFDFNTPYQRQYEELVYGMTDVDYTRLPERFETYSEIDQAKIANRMLAVLRAAQDGVDLEANAPLPIPELLPLDAALAEITSLTGEKAD